MLVWLSIQSSQILMAKGNCFRYCHRRENHLQQIFAVNHLFTICCEPLSIFLNKIFHTNIHSFKKTFLSWLCSLCLRSVEKIQIHNINKCFLFLVYFYILFALKIIAFIINNYIERLNLSFELYPMQMLCLLCSLIKTTHNSFVFIIWRTLF